MGKKFSGVSQTMSRFRGWIQAGATLLTNLHLPNFLKGGLYQGAGKTVCVPGLNCYSCPAASGACPIGAFQAVVGSSKFSFSYYITGFLILLGVLLGRFICGFLCPFGWFQELLHKIPTKKLSTKKPPKPSGNISFFSIFRSNASFRKISTSARIRLVESFLFTMRSSFPQAARRKARWVSWGMG